MELSAGEARRLALSAQGFGPKPARATIAHVRKLASKILAFQIDSVNVLVRAHYMPAFARLGPYPMDAIDTLAYQKHELFEYWGHAACLLPVSLYPLMRHRMSAARAREYMASEAGAGMAKVYEEVATRGPISAGELSEPGKRSGKWWGWSSGKETLEQLFNSGLIAIAARRGFERLYDITERVIPQAALDIPAPPPDEAIKQLICLGAKGCGVGTLRDIAGYFNADRGAGWGQPYAPDNPREQRISKRLVAELVEEGRLLTARVDSWKEPAYVHPEARVPSSVDARAVVSPFDSLIWAIADPASAAGDTKSRPGPVPRNRVARLFGMNYTLELYVPAPKRVYGYYVYAFLLGDTLVARCDLKADRQRRVLMVQSAFLEPGQNGRRVAGELAEELRCVQSWLELDRIEVADRGDLARELKRFAMRGG